MSLTSAKLRSFFVSGGTLPPEADSYVERAADSALLSALTFGRFCYVLNSRQMGKSSLCVRTMKRLQAEGVHTAFVDLTKIGGRNLTPEQWYAGLTIEIGRALGLRNEFLAYWKENEHLSAVQRLFGAIREVALHRLASPIAIFFDEIDATRSLAFSCDEFFAAIRECYNRRVQDRELERLTFCLLGVAVASDLITDPTSTPFNIGERIYLRDFTEGEAAALASGLPQPNGGALVERVFYWTNGHPYLTQSLCQAIAANSSIRSAQDVDALVRRDLFEPSARETNINLADVSNRALHAGDLEPDPEKFRADLLSAYQRVRNGQPLPDDESNRIAAVLKLSGMMRSDGKMLAVRNRIYARVFDTSWVRENMPGQELFRQRQAYRLGILKTTGIAALLLFGVGGLAAFGFRQANRANKLARSLEASSVELRIALSRQRSATERAAAGEREAKSATTRARESADRAKNEKARAQRMAQAATVAKTREIAARRQAEEALRTADAKTSQLLVDRASAFLRDGDAAAALPDLLTALRLDQKDSHRHLVASIRMGAALNAAATLRQVWVGRGPMVLSTFLRGGRVVLTVDAGGEARLWNPLNGTPIGPSMVLGEPATAADISQNGQRLALGGKNGLVAVFDLATGARAGTDRDKGTVKVLRFSPDGKRLAVGTSDVKQVAYLTLRDTGAASLRPAHSEEVDYGVRWSTIAFSPDGKRLMCGFANYITLSIDLDTWSARAFTKQFNNFGIRFLESGNRIILAGTFNDNGEACPAARIFEPDGKKLADVGDVEAAASATSMQVTPDNTKVLITRYTGSAGVYDAGTGQMVGRPIKTIRSACSAISTDGNLVATGSEDGIVRVWEASSGRPLGSSIRHADAVTGLQFSPDSKFLLSWSQDGTTRLSEVVGANWPTGTYTNPISIGALSYPVRGLPFAAYTVDFALNPSLRLPGGLVTVGSDGIPDYFVNEAALPYGLQPSPSGLLVIRIADRRCVGGPIPPPTRGGHITVTNGSYALIEDEPGFVLCYALHPKPRIVFRRRYSAPLLRIRIGEPYSAAFINVQGGDFEFIDLTSGRVVQRGHKDTDLGWVMVGFAAKGTRAVYSDGAVTRIIDCKSGRIIAQFPSATIKIGFSPDRALLTPPSLGISWLVDVTTGRKIRDLPMPRDIQGTRSGFNCYDFSNPDAFLFLGQKFGVYSWTSGKSLQTFEAPIVNIASVSEGGRFVTASDAANVVRVWNFKTGLAYPYTISMESATFPWVSGDGALLCTDTGGILSLYDSETGEFITSFPGVSAMFLGQNRSLVWLVQDAATKKWVFRTASLAGERRPLPQLAALCGLLAGRTTKGIRQSLNAVQPVQSRRVPLGPGLRAR